MIYSKINYTLNTIYSFRLIQWKLIENLKIQLKTILRFVDFYLKHFKTIVLSTVVIVLSIIIFLGWSSAKKVREVVIDDFNKQQLVLAQYVASIIETNISHLKRELILLSLSPTIQNNEKNFLSTRLNITFSSIKEVGAIEIKFINTISKTTFVIKQDSQENRKITSNENELLEKQKDPMSTREIVINDLNMNIDGQNKNIMEISIPVWKTKSANKKPLKEKDFSGIIIFLVDTRSLIEKLISSIKSVKYGYVWIINNTGLFFYHPESELIGKNAFLARQEKNPKLSFVEINEIQKKQMLKGEIGTGLYLSGWHKGIEGEIQKLLAYAPIRIDPKNNQNIWSVAVVTPLKEIEDAIDSIQIRQLVLEIFVIILILLGGIISMAFMLRWSHSLKEEVDKKTKELKKSEYQYKSLIENANDIIFTVNRDGKIISINKAGVKFFKDTMEELVGSSIGELCYSEESAYMQLKTIEEVFATGCSKQITHHVSFAKKEFWLNTSFTPLIDEDGNISLILGISRDISVEKKKEKEEQMYHAEKLASMGTLAAGVAHEINNPLAIILGFSDFLIERFPKDSDEYDMLKTIEKQAINAKRVVENLLSFSRYSEYHLEAVDINNAIVSVISIIKNTMKINNIDLNLNLAENLPKVQADAGELQQVFINILNNAIHAMNKGGIMTISTELSSDNMVQIKFSDTGHGIKLEHRSKIFDPLFTTKKVGEGTGLGLSVSYGIITKYSGTI